MSEDKKLQLHAYIKGRVQGVGFRYHARQSAQDQNLSGWVRNLWDGRVEVVAEGKQEDLNRFLRGLRQGPLSAEVEDVNYEFTDAQGDFKQFRVRATA